ncbi:MAG: LysM peptidoglycan-binding domain-containing protein [candidate division Zixibacteria bacterium]|nr:LysM peptidoglycan-binding domain-containing protein [candidate division Zixibacteria bacterium]
MNKIGLLMVLLVLITGCTRPDPGRLAETNQSTPQNYNGATSNDISDNKALADVDSSRLVEIREALTEAESYYTEGVIYYQRNLLDSSQIAFEEALMALSELEFDTESYPKEARWLETMLKEIESDYRLTLMTSGVLYSEGSAAAFRELFSDIKNFKELKESGQFHKPSKDSVTYDVPIYLNTKVENSLAYLQTVAHNTFETYLGRSGKYIPLMEKILEEEGVPHDIVYLPLIESGFNPHAYSWARAMGPWQFIYATGKRYGMKRNWWYDERRDFEKSTHAAARYLKDLYDEFHAWELALASYNGGEGRVRRTIKRQKTRDFWKLKLKKETRNYVPLFMAAVMIAKQPEKYGFSPVYEDPLEWKTVEVSKCMSFANIASKTGISVADLEILNPELIRGLTPPNYNNYKLRIPTDKKQRFLASYDKIPSEKATNWVSHKIRRGETVSTISRKYGVSMSSVISANSLRRPYRIYVGNKLMIPTTGGGSYSPRASNVIPDGSGSYKVRRGDTLWEIARAHGISIRSIKNANRLSSNRIYPGRKLIIPGAGEQTRASGNEYRVRRGDSLSKIARKYGISIQALKTHNRLRSNTIYPGMNLKIPQSGSSNTSSKKVTAPTTYKVKRGDSLWKIAQRFGVSIRDLMNWNDISNPSKIKRGEMLKIYAR